MIFEPFYTTRDNGTGLGLAVVTRIIEGYDGKILVRSEPGKGTVCTIWLPDRLAAKTVILKEGVAKMAKILVVDDDQGMREFLEIMLTKEGYEVTCASDAAKALGNCRKENFDLIITDLRMPKMDGIGFLREVKKVSPETMVILITAYASGETAVTAMQEGAYDYIEKDFAIEDLKGIIRNALAKKGSNRDEALFLKGVEEASGFGRMIGSSREMLKVYATIKKVADTPANVLILGESGTGKELVAKAIHESSSRAQAPFLVINCGGIPENLLESELFGYVKGSFTGAYSDKAGLFEIAQGGTVFLDEIGELPHVLQVKLLRVVQEKIVPSDRGSRRHPCRCTPHFSNESKPGRQRQIRIVPGRPLLSSQRHSTPTAPRCGNAKKISPY